MHDCNTIRTGLEQDCNTIRIKTRYLTIWGRGDIFWLKYFFKSKDINKNG